jgi:hypothetical protein
VANVEYYGASITRHTPGIHGTGWNFYVNSWDDNTVAKLYLIAALS